MPSSVDQNRAIIHRIFSKEHSLILRGDGLRWIQDMLTHYQVDSFGLEETLTLLADECEKEVSLRDSSVVVDDHLLQHVYEKLQAATGVSEIVDEIENPGPGNSLQVSEDHTLQVIDAFSVPRLVWSDDRKIFELSPTQASILGKPASKALHLRDRYHTIKQVVLRNEHFSPPAVAGVIGDDEREEYMKLTSTNNLLGRAGQRFLLFGMLNQMKDQSYALEDLDGWVKLDLSVASAAEGLFTEGCMVLVEGEYKPDQTFQVMEIGHPPSEHRDVTRKSFANIDFCGAGPLSLVEESRLVKREKLSDSQFIIMSDFYLDEPKVLNAFEKIASSYEEQLLASEGLICPPPVWIICGNFCRKPFLCESKVIELYRSLFSKMATSLSKFPLLTSNIHLILVPGPNDPWDSTLLPRHPLPKSIVQPLLSSSSKIPPERLHLASNPCRIRWMSQEMVIFREDLASKLCRNLMSDVLRDPSLSSDGASVDITKNLVQTILDQAHLSPFALNVQPVAWEFDQALRLYPMPTALVLADSYSAYNLTYEGCHVFNPGSFGVGSRPVWSNYHVASRTSEQRSALTI
ncbi:DNA polymerase alpha/epsilon subunit B-domain-containing protein [Phakopsora pachyrhizi]|uniref:DNA polymerase epsilon subunit n=1 Tax=Phakopsora pachyrhizi TaxID=170000 RepID=A0AAV0BP32_PHAPC|nr:DNA polymerase alpha/epsilon subunit B-domain-containing protein [Phakopsora pachyrhizi]CAH7688783.1 DNA polymerase alpha/epsilon subunit B-domain-containing protein [Phakopsora pachyrhizi]